MYKKFSKKDGKINSNVINIIIIAIIFIALLIYMFCVDDIKTIVSVIQNMKYNWLVVGFVCMVIYWLLEAACLYTVTRKTYTTEKFNTAFRVSMIGQLFNCITPFSSGGQPIQAVAMINDGKKLSNTVSILLIKFIVYQATLVIYTLFLIVLKYSYFKGLVDNFIYLALIGFLVNLGVIVFLILIGVNQKLVYNTVRYIYKVLGKIKLLKNIDERLEHLKHGLTNFSEQFKIIRKEKIMILKLTLYTIIQLTVFFFVTYAVYKSLGQRGESIINIISAQAFLMMIMAFIPLPGAGIAAEGGFMIIFSTFFDVEKINIAVLLWRIYTFYLPIIFGAMFMVINNKKSDKKIKLDTKGVDINVI